MSLPTDRPIFLERAAYRRRRLKDAAKLLPVVTLLLLLVPVWLAPGEISGAAGIIWTFAVWLTVIIASAALSYGLSRKTPDEASPDEL
ncbi:hypothetical protein [Paracoccus aerodenitrificans]|uniref:hypothetical protein n=1 Tax=Paracoccus aerodenitrificans TaxID=3017781 RepID=UPI0022F0C143|nr:hypothetical protein [Paracoccus aerodenitrificans]WBU64177.1 hypothetical protein PAE61_01605 [Paracoccus aerodenitrificans]